MAKFTYYTVLGINSKATQPEMKTAFRAMMKKHHPDMFMNSDKETIDRQTRRFRVIETAFNFLSDPKARADYDKTHADQIKEWDDALDAGVSNEDFMKPKENDSVKSRLLEKPVSPKIPALKSLLEYVPQEFIDAGIEKGDYATQKTPDISLKKKNFVDDFVLSYLLATKDMHNDALEPGNKLFYEEEVMEMLRQNRGTKFSHNALSPKMDFSSEQSFYSMKQFKEMGELLLASKRLGDDYLTAFSNVAQMDYCLKDMKKDTSGMLKEMFAHLQDSKKID
ncbi:MAG: J domain-containing protein [Firmicutes bacterium]|nr:J domain-containing protein [Bacillota bacterium]